jgi:hypothetical protein
MTPQYGVAVLDREITAFLDNSLGVLVDGERVDPDEGVQRLEVDPFLGRKRRPGPDARVELRVPRQAGDVPLGVRVEELAPEELALLRGERLGRLADRAQHRVLGPLAVGQHLVEKPGAEIGRALDGREFLEEERHARAVLRPVEPDPRHVEGSGARVEIRRLMEMPKEREVNHSWVLGQSTVSRLQTSDGSRIREL